MPSVCLPPTSKYSESKKDGLACYLRWEGQGMTPEIASRDTAINGRSDSVRCQTSKRALRNHLTVPSELSED